MEKKWFYLPTLFQVRDKHDVEIHLHLISLTELYERLGTDPTQGLTNNQAKHRLKLGGRNTIDKPDFATTRHRIAKNLFRGFMGPVWFASCLCVLAYLLENFINSTGRIDSLVEALILLMAIVVSTLLRYWKVFDEAEIWHAFKCLQPRYCTVIRDGVKKVISSEEVVLGDVVHLVFGDRVAADLRVIESNDLVIDNVELTGFMSTIALDPNETDANALESPNIALACSCVVRGSGKAVVIAAGQQRLIARVASISGSKKSIISKNDHVKKMMYFNYVLCFAVTFMFIYSVVFTSLSWVNMFVFMTGFIVAFVPLGLLISTHFGQTWTRTRLLAKNCLVQNMEAIDMICSTTVICSDVRGTLTTLRFHVTDLYIDKQLFQAAEEGSEEYVASSSFKALCLSAILCNNAHVKIGMNGVPELKRAIDGGSVDKALFTFVRTYIESIDETRAKFEKIANKPRTSKDGHQVTVHRYKDAQGEMRYLVLIKGTVDIVLKYCATYLINGEERRLNESTRADITELDKKLCASGKLVVGFCDLELDEMPFEKIVIRSDEFQDLIRHMRFVGFVAIYDPPRPTIRHAVRICRDAGIKIVLMTSTSKKFAESIAVFAGLVAGEGESLADVAERLSVDFDSLHPNLSSSIVVDSRKLRGERETLYIENILCMHADVVFAHILEDQRVLVVDICRRMGAVVVNNGSSVLHSPSVRIADIGIAKGITCSNVVKCCADFILLDDSFMTIVTAIEEGRLLYANTKKCVAYIISSNMPLILSFLTFLFLHLPMPIGVQIALIADIAFDMVSSLTMFFEKAETNLMKEKPLAAVFISRQMVFLCFFQIGLIEAAAGFLLYFIIMARKGFLPWDIIGIRDEWYSEIDDLTDSYGQEWTYDERIEVAIDAGSGFFIAIASLQAVNLFVTRTNRENLVVHGFSNYLLNIACILMPTAVICLCYINERTIFFLSSLPDYWWIYLLPFCGLLFTFETLRRYFLRAFPGCWLELETFY